MKQEIDRGPDLPPITDALVVGALNRIQLPNWLWTAHGGATCANCNSDEDIITLTLAEVAVNLCCRCLEEACSYAQP